jgi:hypothetical protein
VATSIEQGSSANLNEVVDSLANHYAQTPQDEKTVCYMALAGAKALQVYSLDEAEQRFRRVIELNEANPGCADEALLIEVLTKLARVHYFKAEMFNIIALVEPYLPRAEKFGDKQKYSRLLFEVGYASIFAARGAAGKPYLEKALAIGEEINDPESIDVVVVYKIDRLTRSLADFAKLVETFDRRKIVTKRRATKVAKYRGGIPFTYGPLAYFLKNRIYLGEMHHGEKWFKGEHAPIIDRQTFDRVQELLGSKEIRRRIRRSESGALLLGKLFDDNGNRMSPSFALD